MSKTMPELTCRCFRLRMIFPVPLLICVNGCATTTHDPMQRIIVSTPGSPGAQCVLKSHTLGERRLTTPAAIDIPRSGETIEVTCHKPCFFDLSLALSPTINVEDLASNGLIGGAAPLAIDLATKRAYNYSYDFIIPMKENKKCRSSGKGFLDGDSKDFDNRIDDFSFDDHPVTLPKKMQDQLKANPSPNPIEN